MHSDQLVSLRPGGGKGRPLGPHIGSSNAIASSASNIQHRLQHGTDTDLKSSMFQYQRLTYTKDILFKLKGAVTSIPQEIKDAVVVINSELAVSDEPERARPAINEASLLPLTSRFLETGDRDWKARTAPDERVLDRLLLKEAGKKSDNDWRVKEAVQNGHGTRISHQQEVPIAQVSSRQQEPQYIRQQEPQYPRHQEPQYCREQEPQYARQQEPQHLRHQEPLFQRPQEPVFQRPQEPLLQRPQEPPFYQRLQEPFYQRQQEIPSLAAAGISRSVNPWMARRGAVSEKERVLRTVKGVLNKLTPEKFNVLVEQLLNAGIVSADILKGVISLVFEKAVLEPTFCSMYAEMCTYLSKSLPEFLSDEDDGKPVTFRRILLNSCQEEFEGAENMRAEIRHLNKPEQAAERFEKDKLVKLRTLGNIKLIGELFKQKMIPGKIVHHCILMLAGSDPKILPAEENIEATCQLLATVGKELEESNKATMDAYFSHLKEWSANPCLPPRIRFIILNTIDLRANQWVPRREEVKAKKLNEIHAEAEKTLGLRPGMTGMRNGLVGAGVMGLPGMGSNIPHMRPGSMMPGMPGLLPVAGMLPRPAPLIPNFFPGPPDSGGGWQYAMAGKNRLVPEGLMAPPNILPGGTYGAPNFGLRPNLVHTKFPHQVNSGVFMGRPNALLGDTYGKPFTPVVNMPPAPIKQVQHNIAPARNPGINMERLAESLPRQTTTAATAPSMAVRKKAESLLMEYLSVGDRDEALLCVQELKSPDFYPHLVQMGVTMGLESTDRGRELISKLLEFLYFRRVLSQGDIRKGIMMVAGQLEDIVLDAPMAPKHVGDLVGKALLAGVADLGLLTDILQRTEDPMLKRSLYDAASRTIKASPLAERSTIPLSKLMECERLVGIKAVK